MQAIADLQLQELQQARDRVFQAAIRREARQVAAMIAAAPPLVPSSSDPGLNETASSGTNPHDLTGDEEEAMKVEKEEEEEEEQDDDTLANVQATAEIQLQELKEARDRVFQAAIQREARQVAAMIAAAPPLATSSLDSDVASSGTNLAVLTEEEEQKDATTRKRRRMRRKRKQRRRLRRRGWRKKRIMQWQRFKQLQRFSFKSFDRQETGSSKLPYDGRLGR